MKKLEKNEMSITAVKKNGYRSEIILDEAERKEILRIFFNYADLETNDHPEVLRREKLYNKFIFLIDEDFI